MNVRSVCGPGAVNVRRVRDGTVSEKVRALGAGVCCV